MPYIRRTVDNPHMSSFKSSFIGLQFTSNRGTFTWEVGNDCITTINKSLDIQNQLFTTTTLNQLHQYIYIYIPLHVTQTYTRIDYFKNTYDVYMPTFTQ